MTRVLLGCFLVSALMHPLEAAASRTRGHWKIIDDPRKIALVDLAAQATQRTLSQAERDSLDGNAIAEFTYLAAALRACRLRVDGDGLRRSRRCRPDNPPLRAIVYRTKLNSALQALLTAVRSRRRVGARFMIDFYREHGALALLAHIVATEMPNRILEELAADDGWLVRPGGLGPYGEMLKDEPDGIRAKVLYWLRLGVGPQSAAILRLVELGPPARDELLRVLAEPPDRSDDLASWAWGRSVFVAIYVFGATSDPRILELPLDELAPEPSRARRYLRARLASQGRRDLFFTRANWYHRWSGGVRHVKRRFFACAQPDSTEPVVECGAPSQVERRDLPVTLTASAEDNCSAQVTISKQRCGGHGRGHHGRGHGGRCKLTVSGTSITIERVPGGDAAVEWVAEAVDESGNRASRTCTMRIVPRGRHDRDEGDDDDRSDGGRDDDDGHRDDD